MIGLEDVKNEVKSGIGRPHKFDWSLMNELLKEKTPTEVAKELGVTLVAVKYAMKKTIQDKIKRSALISTATFEKGREVANRHLDTVAQLKKINQYSNEILDLVKKAIGGDKTAIKLLNVDKNFKRKDPLEILVKLNAEIREQLYLQDKIFERLYSIEQMDEFREEVLSVLESYEPGRRAKILASLREKSLLRSAIQWRDKK